MKIEWLKSVCSAGSHNAFTDLCLFNNKLYCCFRQALNHVSDDGIIRIFTMNWHGDVIAKSTVRIAHCDLRDPKLSVSSDGKLLLIAYARNIHSKDSKRASKNLSWVSSDGHSWSTEKSFAQNNWWLWRVRWKEDTAYGFAYNRAANAIDLYKGDPRRTFEKIQTQALSLAKHQLGYPNESDLIFSDSKCFALIRRDADSYSAQLGQSQYPFKRWRWRDLGFYLGGPVMQKIDADNAIAAGRVIHDDKLVTAVFYLNLHTGKVGDKLFLPSAGDNSYPGVVLVDEHLYLSYYSSHKDNKSAIYLVKIHLSDLRY